MVNDDTAARLEPSRTALVLLDFMNASISFAADAVANGLLDRARQVRADARKAGIRVVYVRVGLDAADYASISEYNKLFAPFAAAQLLGEHDPSTEIIPELAPLDGEVVVTKKRVGAFYTSNLGLLLSPRRFDTLVLCGIATSGVVLSTVREAADRDYRIIVLSDCCADADPDLHDHLMQRCFPMQSDVITSESFRALLGASS